MNNKIHFRAFHTSRYYIAITYRDALHTEPTSVVRMHAGREEEQFAWMLNRWENHPTSPKMTEAERKGRQNGEPRAREAECWVEAMLSLQTIVEREFNLLTAPTSLWANFDEELVELNDDDINDLIEQYCYDNKGIE